MKRPLPSPAGHMLPKVPKLPKSQLWQHHILPRKRPSLLLLLLL